MEYAITSLEAFKQRNEGASSAALERLAELAVAGGNTFDGMLECAKVCSLGQMTGALYQVGGRYRRNM
jgi:isobutyryl-CoA mutase